MKVAFITFEYPPFVQGGAGTYAKNITKELGRLGNDVHVITPHLNQCTNYEVKDGVFIHRVNFSDKPLLRAPSYWVSLRKEFRKIEAEVGRFDIVHGNATSDFSLARSFTKETPRIVTVHHLARDVLETLRPSVFARIKRLGGETGITPFIERVCIQRADMIVAVSQYTKGKLTSIYGVSPDRIEVIHNGWEEKSFVFTEEEKAEVRAKYNIGNDMPILLFVGRIDDRRKGLDVLLKALKIVLKKTDATLVAAGSGKQKPFRQLSSSLGIASRVIFTGFVDNVTLQKLYSVCDIYVCPSRLEGFGLTILDAMAAGKPVVATRVGAIPELIEQGKNGFLAQDNNETELATAIIQILDSSSHAEAMGENNRKKAQMHYSWEIAGRRVAEVYAELARC